MVAGDAEMPNYVVTAIQRTPNPNALKFILDHVISKQPLSFFNPEAAGDHEIACRLFQVSGISSLLLLGDFLTVNKRPEASWKAIKASVCEILLKLD